MDQMIRKETVLFILSAAIAIQCIVVTQCFARRWTNTTGKYSVEAPLIDVSNEEVVLRKPDGTRITVPLARLSNNDRAFARLQRQPRFVVQTGQGIISSVAFSPDGRQLLTGSWDHTARLWDRTTGKELCRIFSFDDGWAVVDSDGRYDASGDGIGQWLHWVIVDEPIALDQLKH